MLVPWILAMLACMGVALVVSDVIVRRRLERRKTEILNAALDAVQSLR